MTQLNPATRRVLIKTIAARLESESDRRVICEAADDLYLETTRGMSADLRERYEEAAMPILKRPPDVVVTQESQAPSLLSKVSRWFR